MLKTKCFQLKKNKIVSVERIIQLTNELIKIIQKKFILKIKFSADERKKADKIVPKNACLKWNHLCQRQN